jgi:raffinose/stachyose/melibiose transport system permease protein
MNGRRQGARHYPPLNDLAGRLTPFVYVGPTLLVVLVFIIYPLLSVVYYGGLEWSGLGNKVFIGISNFVNLFRDPLFWSALKTNLVYVVFFSFVPVILGLLLSSVIGRVTVPGEKAFRAILLAPQVIASVAMGIIFGWIFAPTFWVLNGLLAVLGLARLQLPWLGNQVFAPISIGLVGTWLWVGFAVIVFFSGVKKVDESLYDAAKMDGASSFRQLMSVTIPQVRPEIVVVIIMTLVWSFGSSVFGIVVAISGGGYGTTPISLYAYQLAFIQGRMGYGSSIVIVLMIMIIGLSALAYRLGEGRK